MALPNIKHTLFLSTRPHTTLSRAGNRKRIVSQMVDWYFESACRNDWQSVGNRYTIGSFELREPDYWQVLLWAKELQWSPEQVLYTLAGLSAIGYDGRSIKLRIEDGAIRDLVWDGKLMRLKNLEWVTGLCIQTLAIKKRMPKWQTGSVLQSLRYLDCVCLGLSELDLSSMPGLTVLFCRYNQLTELDLSSVPGLTALACGGNQLAKLDLSPVPGLTKLWCGENKLTELDLSSVPGLIVLSCRDNQLTKLDLSSVPGLMVLACESNQLAKLDLSSVPGLTKLWCGENKLTKLDLSSVPGLTVLSCDYKPA